MDKMKFAVIGCGFWSQFQIAAWKELKGVELLALYNRTRSKAARLGERFDVPRIYDSAREMLENEELDFVDIITNVGTHEKFVSMAAAHELPVICQKPMAPDYETAQRMVETCQEAEVPFMVHENWRWQKPIRATKEKLASGVIGRPFRARISYCNSFPVFENQPFLAELEQFIIADMGSHILDVARFLLGEAKSIYCQTATVHEGIAGEDVASISMEMEGGIHCNVELSYASKLEQDRFPETYILIEGAKGSIKLAPDYWLRTTTEEGTHSKRLEPQLYDWADPQYKLIHASIVEANRDFLHALKGAKEAETKGQDNLKTVELVYGAYESAERGEVLEL